MLSSVMSMIKKDRISTNCVEFLEAIENSWCFSSPFTSNHSSPTQEQKEKEGEEEEEKREESVSHEKEEEKEKSINKEVVWQLFQIVDEEKDGLVSAHELLSFLSKIGLSLTLQGLYTMINLSKATHNSNRNHNHDYGFGRGESATLTFHDFHSLCIWAQMEKMEGQIEEQEDQEADEDEDELVLSAFRVFDMNGDGFISAEELRNALACMGLVGRSIEECQKLIERVDRDANGLIDLSEFKHMLSSHSSLPCTVSA